MKKKSLVTVLVFLGLIGGLSLTSLVMKDRDFSPNENRVLAEVPEFSWTNVLSGDFQDGLEEYLKDQIAFRDQWISVKTFVQKLTFNTDIGGAYVGKDGYDFEKITPDDVKQEQVDKNTKAVEEYFEYCSKTLNKDNLYFMLVPTSGLVYSDKLPRNAILFDQNQIIDDIEAKVTEPKFINVRDCFLKSAETQLYYKTDHHWTTAGAFEAYCQWRSAAGRSQVSRADYTEETVTDSFRGSLYSKILDIDSSYDDIKAMKRDADASYTVVADGKDIGSIFQEDKLSEKDKYAYFMGGNYGEATIHKEQGTGKGNLLLIKDSFANSMVSFLADDYENIYMIDLRYYPGDMAAYISEHNITDVMILYNVSNFVSDKNLFKLTKNIR